MSDWIGTVGDAFMTPRDALRSIRKAPTCWAWVRLIPEDGIYIRISKVTARHAVQQAVEKFNAEQMLAHVDESGDFHIN
jgi:hypothetical protein